MNRFYRLTFILLMIATVLGQGTVNGRTQSIPERIKHEIIPNDYRGWNEWYQEDQTYIKKTFLLERKKEIAALKSALGKLRQSPDYRDSQIGFKVFSPSTTGKMQLISAAIAARSTGAADHRWLSLYGNRLMPESKNEQAKIGEAIDILRNLPVSRDALNGFELYLMPYSMGDTSGLGGNGYAYIAAAPRGLLLIPNQLQVTLVHEVGHHIHLKYMARTQTEGLKRWGEYLKLRGIPWNGPGSALSPEWSASSEEVLAEDFRVWVSSPNQDYFGDLAYPNPEPEKGKKLRAFFLSLSRAMPISPENPWLIKDNRMNTESVLLMFLLLVLPLGWAIKIRPCGREIPITSSCL